MTYQFRTDFLNNDENDISDEDIDFLFELAMNSTNLIFKENIFNKDDIKGLEKNTHIVDKVNGNLYSISLNLDKTINKPNEFINFVFQFKLDNKNKPYLTDLSLTAGKIDYKIEIFKQTYFICDNISVELDKLFNIISYSICLSVDFKYGFTLYNEYLIKDNLIRSIVEYNWNLKTGSPNEHFEIVKENITQREIYRDFMFLMTLLKIKYNNSGTEIFSYIDYDNIEIASNLKNALIAFRNENRDELKDKFDLLNMLTI